MFHRRFLFGNGKTSEPTGAVRVRSTDFYQQDTGYGFVTEQNRREDESLRLSELNAAFDTVYWYRNEDMTRILEDGEGCFVDSDAIVERYGGQTEGGEKRRLPLIFKADVEAPGNYRVKVVIRAKKTMELLLFQGRRRLVWRGRLLEGQRLEKTFPVNVCDIIPRGKIEFYPDRSVDITVVADMPELTEVSIEACECPTIFIAGDSTVTDQSAEYPYAPGCSYAGWGQMLPAYLKGGMAVSNHAHSGLTTDSFRSEGHYLEIGRSAKPGDFILFQFGHNDQKLPELKAKERYDENLCTYIRESRERGLYPLLVTPLARNSWRGRDNQYNDLLKEYGEAVLEAGSRMQVPVLDLHRYSRDWIMKQGREVVKPYFYPGDFTHTNDYGAYRMAGIIAEEIKAVCGTFQEKEYQVLADQVADRTEPWEIEGKIALPVKPEAYRDLPNPEEEEDALASIDRPEEPASRVDVLDMQIKALHYFPINVYNDMFQDVVGHEWYAGTVECAWQNGMIDEGLIEEGCFYPERKVTLEEFLVLALSAYQGRKELPKEQPCPYDERCRDYARPFVRAAYRLSLIAADGGEDMGRLISRGEAAALCRKMRL